jgi:hypothetical protein
MRSLQSVGFEKTTNDWALIHGECWLAADQLAATWQLVQP